MSLPPEVIDVHEVEREDFPEFDGHRAVLHISDDGRIYAGTYWLRGRHTWELPYDDFFYVVAGSATFSVEGGESFEVSAGSFGHLRKGWVVTADMSDDFHEVSTLISDAPIDITSH